MDRNSAKMKPENMRKEKPPIHGDQSLLRALDVLVALKIYSTTDLSNKLISDIEDCNTLLYMSHIYIERVYIYIYVLYI